MENGLNEDVAKVMTQKNLIDAALSLTVLMIYCSNEQ